MVNANIARLDEAGMAFLALISGIDSSDITKIMSEHLTSKDIYPNIVVSNLMSPSNM
jgi:hypothetical protein